MKIQIFGLEINFILLSEFHDYNSSKIAFFGEPFLNKMPQNFEVTTGFSFRMERSKESSSCTLPVVRGRTPLQNCVVAHSFETINLSIFKIISVTYIIFYVTITCFLHAPLFC